MSYCRWSSSNFGCDLYVYEDTGGGWTIHVAANRVVGHVPEVVWPIDPNDPEANARFATTQSEQTKFVVSAKREPIALPHAGETFNLPTALACAEKVEELAALGYRVPAYVAATLREEADA